MKYTPNKGKVIVERAKVKKTINGIVMPTKSQERPQMGMVTAVGEPTQNDDGTYNYMNVSVGDMVMFTKHAGNKLPHADDLWIMDEGFIIGVIDE